MDPCFLMGTQLLLTLCGFNCRWCTGQIYGILLTLLQLGHYFPKKSWVISLGNATASSGGEISLKSENIFETRKHSSRMCIAHFSSWGSPWMQICCDIGQHLTYSPEQNSSILSSCQVTILITRMTFSCSCFQLMSFESMEITINTYRCW